MIKLTSIGECMIELRHESDYKLNMSFAGDTWNTALYLARYRPQADLAVRYMTALGDDIYSQKMLMNWDEEGLDCDFVTQVPNTLPGLYLIHNDEQGERSFYYYRQHAPVRTLFAGEQGANNIKRLLDNDHLYLSGITLALYDDEQLARLLDGLREAKELGVKIWFDPNYRPALWKSVDKARDVMNKVASMAQGVLTTLDDEIKLNGCSTKDDCLTTYSNVPELVVKLGSEGAISRIDNVEYQVSADRVKAIDTTAAGDSFNAAYLMARLRGHDTKEALQWGCRLARRVVQYPGAVLPKNDMPSLIS